MHWYVPGPDYVTVKNVLVLAIATGERSLQDPLLRVDASVAAASLLDLTGRGSRQRLAR